MSDNKSKHEDNSSIKSNNETKKFSLNLSNNRDNTLNNNNTLNQNDLSNDIIITNSNHKEENEKDDNQPSHVSNRSTNSKQNNSNQLNEQQKFEYSAFPQQNDPINNMYFDNLTSNYMKTVGNPGINNLGIINNHPFNNLNLGNMNNININNNMDYFKSQLFNHNLVFNPQYNDYFNLNDSNYQENQLQYQQNDAPYLYNSNKTTYSLDFQVSQTCDRIALGSLEYSLDNKIDILSIQNDKLTLESSEFHQYPISRIQWCPFLDNNCLFGTTSDILRIYRYNETEKKIEKKADLLNKKSKYSDPLTSFDWNKVNDSIIGTASLDTTCTIWDVNKETIKTQLIAHDKEVLDIAFSLHDEHIFISAGADGSIRQFDLRSLEHSTILYECRQKSEFTRVSWNSQNKDQFSAISDKKKSIYVINIPSTDKKKKELNAHSNSVNSFAWAPNDQSILCTVGEDGYAYIWDLENDVEKSGFLGPDLQYNAGRPIKNVSWSKSNQKWIGIVYENCLKLLNL